MVREIYKSEAVLYLIVSFSLVLLGCEKEVSPPSEAVFGSIAFQNVRVIKIADNEVFDNYTVLIEADRISAMGPSGSLSIPTNTYLIDGAGLTLMPGLTDMHAHYEDEVFGPLFILNGITTVRNMWGTRDQFSYDARAKSGELAGPNVYSVGPLIDGVEPFREDSVSIGATDEAVAVVNSQFEEGYRDIKLYEMLAADVYKAAVNAAKEKGMRIATHTPVAMQVEDLLDLKIDSVEHLDGYGESLSSGQFDKSEYKWYELFTVSWKYVNEDAIEPIARRTAAAEVWNVPTLTYYREQFMYANDINNFLSRDEIDYLPPGLILSWFQAIGFTNSAVLHNVLETYLAGEPARMKLVKALFDSSAPLLVGTDTPNPLLIPGFSLHDEIANFSKAGIPSNSILQIATSEAARFLEAEREFGIVEPGARADLILVDGDPISDLSILRKPVGIMVNGNWRTREQIIEVLEYNASKFVTSLEDKINLMKFKIYHWLF